MQSSKGSSDGLIVGAVIAWPLSTIPDNYLECNGQAVNSSLYPKLAVLMSNVPDYQGIFLRGLGNQSFSQPNGSLNGVTSTDYSSANLGQIQGDSIRNIWGNEGNLRPFPNSTDDGAIYREGILKMYYPAMNTTAFGYTLSDAAFHFDASRIVPTANENRPINKAVIYLIKAK